MYRRWVKVLPYFFDRCIKAKGNAPFASLLTQTLGGFCRDPQPPEPNKKGYANASLWRGRAYLIRVRRGYATTGTPLLPCVPQGATIFSAKIVGIYKSFIQKWQVLSSFRLGYEGITPILSASFGDVIPTLNQP